jgi:predicted dehydrogenase
LETNVGVIGLGKMGVLHSAILNTLPRTKLRAIYEKNRFLVKAGGAFLPKTIRMYRDLDSMLAREPIDALFITTPIHSHVDVIIDALKSDRHLNFFVEKPLASSYPQARAACKAVSKLKCVHMVGFQKRFSPIFQKGKQIIETRQLGDPVFFRAHSFSSDVLKEGKTWRFQKGRGGVLLDLGPHILDLLAWYFGEPKPLTAVKKRFYSREVEDYVHALVSFDSGLKGYVDVCWSMRNFRLPEISIEVHGKEGILTVTDDSVTVEMSGGEKKNWYKQSFNTPIPFLLADPEFTKEDQTFLNAVEGSTSATPDFYHAAKTNALIDKIATLSQKTSK